MFWFKKKPVKKMEIPPPSYFDSPGVPINNVIMWLEGKDQLVLVDATKTKWAISVLNGELCLTKVENV